MIDEVTAGEAYRYAHRHEAECGERWKEARTAADVLRADVQRIRLNLAAEHGAREARRQVWERQMRRLQVWGGTIATVLGALQMLSLYFGSGSFG